MNGRFPHFSRIFGFILIACLWISIKCQESTNPAPTTEAGESDASSTPSPVDPVSFKKIDPVVQNFQAPDGKDSISLAPVEEEDRLAASGTILKRILSHEVYQKFVRPKGLNGTGSPVTVSVSILIRNIENIDDVDMEYNLQMTFRQGWLDPRLAFGHVHPSIPSLQLITPDRIWMPDIFFSNEKEGKSHDLMVPNFFGKIFPNGFVLVSNRISLRLSCPMQLHHYPMDTQRCPLRIASYGYLDTDMQLKWRQSNETVMMATKFLMPRFRLNSYEMQECASVTSTGAYGCILLLLEFQREFGYYMIQIYAPCIMLVFVSWVAFWLEPTATEARVSLAVTAILTAVTQVDGINDSVPPASYVKAIDVWTFMTQFMVFAAIIQFSYINYVVHFQWKRIAKGLDEDDDYLRENKDPVLRARAVRKAKRIDRFCQIVFPLTFGLFNLGYWTYYLRTPPGLAIPIQW